MAISKHSLTLSVNVATKLGEKVAVLWSDAYKAIAIQKAAGGDYEFRQVGKNKSSRSMYCKDLIETKRIRKGRYPTQFYEKNHTLIARLS